MILIVLRVRQSKYKDNPMCGKKSNMRESPDDERRKQTLENSLFYYEYLNNTLNYILSGSNDLEHHLNYDQQALKHIISTEPSEESVYFIERTKMMKTRCDPNFYLKDLQEYGQFTNYESSRTAMYQNRNIQRELEEEKEINLLIKRLKKRYKIQGELTVFEARRMNKKLKDEIVNSMFSQMAGRKVQKKGNLEDNRLYRQMFNITQNAVKEEIPDQNRAAKLARSKMIKKSNKPVKEEYPFVPKAKESAKQQIYSIRRSAEPTTDKYLIEPQLQPVFNKTNITSGVPVLDPIHPSFISETSVIQPMIKQQQKEQPFLTFQNSKSIQNYHLQKKQNSLIPEKAVQKQLSNIPVVAPVTLNQQYNHPFYDGNSETQAHDKRSTKQKKITKAGQGKKKKQINYREYSDDDVNNKKDKNDKKRSYNKRSNPKLQMHPFSSIHHFSYRSPIIHMDQPVAGYPIVPPPPKESVEIGIQVDPNDDIQPLKVLTPRRPFTFSIITNTNNITNPNNPPLANPNNFASVPAQRIIENQCNSINNSLDVSQGNANRMELINPQSHVQHIEQNNPILTDSQRFFNQSRDFSASRPRADSMISQGRNNSEGNASKKDDIDIFLSFLDK